MIARCAPDASGWGAIAAEQVLDLAPRAVRAEPVEDFAVPLLRIARLENSMVLVGEPQWIGISNAISLAHGPVAHGA